MTSTKSWSLQRKILFAFGIPFFLSLLLSSLTVFYLVNSLLLNQVQSKVSADLRSARGIYEKRGERVREVVRLASENPVVQRALKDKNPEGLKGVLQQLRASSGEDFLTVVDEGGRVVMRSRNVSSRGDLVTGLTPVASALIGEATVSSEIMGENALALEGEDLLARSVVELSGEPAGASQKKTELRRGLALIGGAPVYDGAGNIIGAVYGGHLLNRDFSLVDEIRSTLFAGQSSDNNVGAAATITLLETRVATNVKGEGGQRAVGTKISPEVAKKVLLSGDSYFDRAYVVNDWYLSAYGPIKNGRDEVVGVLYVGVPEKPYRFLIYRAILLVGLLELLGLGIGFFFFWSALARMLTRPLNRLSEGALRIGSGDLSHRIPEESDDEIGQLAKDFNAMTGELSSRDVAIKALAADLEMKIAERNAALLHRDEALLKARSEMLEVMEKQKATNMELQNSFERLKETQEELVRSGKLAALGAMAAGVAHEINTPLATIRGNVEIMTMHLAEIPECADELLRIEQQADRMQSIVQNLLTFARVERPNAEPTDLRRALIDVIQSMAPRSIERQVEVKAEIPDYLPPVMANFEKLVQVFNNLANNALQAMERGGTLVIIAATDDERGEVRASFTDDGVGIAPQDMPKVWNPFFSTKPAGTGLGLSISHALVEGFGGKITLVSEPGKGTTFMVHLQKAL